MRAQIEQRRAQLGGRATAESRAQRAVLAGVVGAHGVDPDVAERIDLAQDLQQHVLLVTIVRIEREAQPRDLAHQRSDIASPGIDVVGEAIARVHERAERAVLFEELAKRIARHDHGSTRFTRHATDGTQVAVLVDMAAVMALVFLFVLASGENGR